MHRAVPNHPRNMTVTDIPTADMIRAQIGWNQIEADWRRLLDLEPGGCFLVENGGTIAGTVTTTRYGATLGWIGMLLVHPDHRRQGIGTALLRRAIDYLRGQGVRCIGLDATPAGQILYDAAGFETVWPLARWESSRLLRFPRPEGIVETAIAGEVWPQVIALDGRAFGLERPHLLRALARQSTRTAVAFDAHGQFTGFGMTRTGANAIMIGPLAAVTPRAAADLLTTLCADQAGERFFWDIPESNHHGVDLAKTLGFTRQRPLTRMVLGGPCPVATPTSLYAVADLATG